MIVCFCLIHMLNTVPTEIELLNWYFHGDYTGDMDPTLLLFRYKPWFYITGYVYSKNNWYRSTENFMLIHQVPLYDVFGECYSLNTRIVEPSNL